ncbi:MAG: AMP-binding protein, partial [Bdellovibrionota bacterium]
MLIAQQLTVNAGKNMAKPAFRYLGKETNYKDLCAAISRLSYLYQHEIGQGNRVAFYARNSPAYIATFFAMTNTRSVT